MDIEMIRGDTTPFNVTVYKPSGVQDLTNAEIWLTAKLRLEDIDSDAIIAVNSTDNPTQVIVLDPPTAGKVQIIVMPGDTAALTRATALYYDVQVKLPDTQVKTVVSGILYVKMDVTLAS